jgi:hypothetical protein
MKFNSAKCQSGGIALLIMMIILKKLLFPQFFLGCKIEISLKIA